MTKKNQIIVCEHCGNKTPHEIVFTINGPYEIIKIPNYTTEIATYYYLTKCTSCLDISLFSDWDESESLGDLNYASLMYPASNELDSIVPSQIVKDFEEAKKVIKKSPLAFAVLVRRALENICIDQKAKGRNLKEKIEDLAKKDIIPKPLARMASAIRYLGNIGAHASDESVDEDEVKTLNDFMRAIIEYVYVAPDKLNRLIVKVKTKKKKIRNLNKYGK